MQPINNCPSCYEIALPECPTHIRVKAGLSASANYVWFIKDKFNNGYYSNVTTDENGDFIISIGNLPIGLLNQHAGAFELTVKQGYSDCNNVPLMLCGEPYTCVKMQFVQQHNVSDDEASEDGDDEITIPCECGEQSEEGV